MKTIAEESSTLNVDRFEDKYKLKQPVVIRNGSADWPAMHKWQQDYLNDQLGERTVHVQLNKNGYYHYGNRKYIGRADMSYKETSDIIFSETEESRGVYIVALPIESYVPELKKDIKIPKWLRKPKQISRNNFWLGGGEVTSALHWDPFENLTTQVKGSKKFTFYAPSDTPNLYRHESMRKSTFSSVDPENPDLEKFPKFANATKFEITVHPGDILYIPPQWWHQVTSLDTAISVNFFYWSKLTMVKNIGKMAMYSIRSFFSKSELAKP